MAKDDALIEEIRDRFTYASNEWAAIRREGSLDMRYIAGDPWDPKDRKARTDAGRPCLSLDELGQYVNQVINDLRQNKRGIVVSPVGFGANDKTAEFLQGRIRDLEYRSNAQQAYTTMAENAIQRGYGYLRIRSKYTLDDAGFDQEPVIEPILNPDLVTPDPDFLRTDGSDWKYLFYHEWRMDTEFAREFPKADKKTFWALDRVMAPKWYDGKRITLAEYWRREEDRKRTLYLLKAARSQANPTGEPREVYSDALPATPGSDDILKSREVSAYRVRMYLTNGFEILKQEDWPGLSIPFVSCYGKVIYVDRGDGVKRELLSMTRLARDPYMLYCYYRTCEAELVGMTPKFPYFSYVGQLDDINLKLLAKSLHVPVATIQVKPTVPGASPNTVLPPPQRQPYEPPIQALELGAEAARRAIQSAMGTTFLPTQAQRRNEKSGRALDKIEETAQKGSFHFVDHYDEGVTRVGALLVEVIPSYDDRAKDVSIRQPDDTVAMVRINDPNTEKPVLLDKTHKHDVTISVGPWKESEREAASDFADTLIGSPIIQLAGPQKGLKLAAQAIRLKGVGPVGDAMADILDPKDPQMDPQQLRAHAAQMAQELEQLKQIAAQQNEDLKTDRIKVASQERQTQAKIDWEREKLEKELAAKIEIARITAAKQGADLDAERQEEERALNLELAHEAVEADRDRIHDIGMAALQHRQALEQADQAMAGTLAGQAQQAALTPAPPSGA